MSLQSLLVHDVTVVTPGSTTDRYGNTVADWATSTSTTVKGWITQSSGTENEDGRDAQIGEWRLFLPAGTVVDGHARVEWGGITFEVVGPPERAWTPRGEHHVEVQLRVVEG